MKSDTVPATQPAVDREFGYFALRMAQYAILLLSTIAVSRALGPEGRAHYALPVALSSAVWTVSYLSVEAAAGRLLGRREAELRKMVRLLSACAIAISVIGVAATLLLGWFGRDVFVGGAGLTIIAVAALNIPGLVTQQLAGYILLLVGRLREYAVGSLISALLQLALVLLFIVAGGLTPLRAAIATMAGFGAWGGLMVVGLARHAGASALWPRVDRGLARRLLRAAAGIHPLSMALLLGPALELLIVGALTSTRETGLYSLALTLAAIPHFASWTLAQTGLRSITEKSEQDAVDFACEFSRQTALLSVGIALAGCAVAYPFVVLGYGPEWGGAVVPLMILISATVAWSIENPLRLLLLRIAQPIQMAALALGGLLLNAGLTVALVDPLGITGAALASLVAYWAYAFAMLFLVKRTAKRLPLGRSLRIPRRGDWAVDIAVAALRRLRPRRDTSTAA
jgi:O-antigen/teichoic acid export membrane protein